MTPHPGLLQANIDFLPADAAELEFSITAAIETNDVQALWDRSIIVGLAHAKVADSITFGRLISLIENKFSKEINKPAYRQAIKDSPLFDSTAELNRAYELDLHRHYQRSGYWDQEPNRHVDKNHDKLGQ